MNLFASKYKRLTAGQMTTLWVNCPQYASQPGQLNHSSFWGQRMSSNPR